MSVAAKAVTLIHGLRAQCDPALQKLAIAAGVSSLIGKALQKKVLLQESKRDGSPVTVADIAIQVLVADVLGGKFVGEETIEKNGSLISAAIASLQELLPRRILVEASAVQAGGDEWSVTDAVTMFENNAVHSSSCLRGPYFIIDPVDGTAGFLLGEQFAIGIAEVDGDVVRASIACPNLSGNDFTVDPDHHGYLALAMKGGGAWLFDMAELCEGQSRPPVKLPLARKSPLGLRLLESRDPSHTSSQTAREAAEHAAQGLEVSVIRADSMAKYVFLCMGNADILLRLPGKEYKEKVWDVAPGALLLKESGGLMCHADQSPVNCKGVLYLENSSGIVAVGPTESEFLLQRVCEFLHH